MHGEGGIHGNPVSGHHQRHHHTEPVIGILSKPDINQQEGGEGNALKLCKINGLFLKASKQVNANYANHEVPPAEVNLA